ncbi:TPA_asm: aldo/keto reductase [Salmonella enterica subsp. salamae serovar 60:g,m,t:z6]|uniref:Aldo/keto reductase n=1 Tax=Salmonella enterica subsp. houtenae serovar 1,40:z4,z32:- TaxID=1967604 RepID=A0A730WNZ1_SALHO|nr:aldo/keto reductase [Salmonella enterica]HAC6700302.1 aldo/keto reductase [Salmonella bongori serovar 66:z65:-]HAE2269093.1 aldo/keto reductase [Salmonella enterica subsp. enterica serovar 1,9,12:-:-]HAE4190636.1 aldo/keto reductase [Salmonella enterica subsp. houtenae serovar 1,40:z4,z32:-]HAE7514801.1 aldo/keto reductase [Salmonella enterica subsp. salamae serovar 60:g,m,t:z6]
MKQRQIGTMTVSAVGLGCMGLSQAYGAQDEAASLDTLHRAIELGVTFFDTAEVYGPWRNEILLGKVLKAHRDKVVLATKFGFTYNREQTEFGQITGTDGRPENARRVAEASLKRLQTEVIDLYYLHRADPKIPIEETVGAMAELVAEGKVRTIGLSEVSSETIRRAHAVHPVAAVQSEYSLWTRDVETNGVLETCRELGIAFVPFSPLGRGFLTGQVPATNTLDATDFRRNMPRFQREHIEANRLLVKVIEDMATRKGVTAAQIALAWVLAQGNDIVPIPGAKRIAHLEQNARSVDIVLSAADCSLLEATFRPERISGGRYSPTFEAMSQK